MEGQINIKKLPIDLISINCVNPIESLKALNYCNNLFSFNNTILFSNQNFQTDINQVNISSLNSIKEYNNFVLSLNRYIESDFVLIIQDDGHIVNPKMWLDEYLEYDYIGAPWPNSRKWKSRFKKKYNKQTADQITKNIDKNQVGNGGFSLRSKKFLEYSSSFADCNDIDEDIFLCIYNYEVARDFGINFAPFSTAKNFSYEMSMKKFIKYYETKNKKFYLENHFGWHGKRFSNYEALLDLKNIK